MIPNTIVYECLECGRRVPAGSELSPNLRPRCCARQMATMHEAKTVRRREKKQAKRAAKLEAKIAKIESLDAEDVAGAMEGVDE